MTDDPPPHPYLLSQVATHAAVRRDLTRLSAALAPSRKAPSPQAVAAYWEYFSYGMHHHHELEDTIYWPLMSGKRPEITDTFDAAEAEHAAIASVMDLFDKTLAAWRDGSGDIEPVRAAFAQVTDAITVHLTHEESTAWPLIRELVTPEDMGRLVAQGAADNAWPPAKQFAWAFDEAPPEARAVSESLFPVAVIDQMMAEWGPPWQAIVAALADES